MKKVLMLLALFASYYPAQAQVTASFNVSDSNICAGQDVIFTFTGQGANLYQWDFGDGSVLQSTTNPIKTKNFWETGTYRVFLYATDGNTTDTADIFIRVRPKIETGFSIAETSNGGHYCLGTALSISQWSNIAGYDSLQWDFGDGTTSNLLYPKHTYATSGNFDIKLKVKGFCGEGEHTVSVSIVDDARGKPKASLSVNPMELCPNQTVNVNVWPGSTPIDSLQIDMGDGNATQLDEFDYNYPNTGQYTIEAITFNACGSDTTQQSVKVTDNVMRSGNVYVNNSMLCLGQEMRGSASSQGAIRYIINYGDGIKDTIPEYTSFKHQYADTGTYTVEATFDYACGPSHTAKKTVTIGTGTPVFNFSINSYRNQYCLGETVQFNAPWLYPGDTLHIDFGDVTTEKFVDTIGQVFHTYASAKNYTVKAVKRNVCGFSKQVQTNVRISNDAKPRLTINADYNAEGSPLCQDDTVQLAMQAEGYSLTNPTFTFEDGSKFNGEKAFKTFKNGEHLIKATATNLCGTDLTAYYTLVILNHTANPSLSYYFYPQTQCVNQEFFFDVFANGAKEIKWDMGDGSQLTSDPNLPHFMYAYNASGMYTVNITAINGCGMSKAIPKVNVAQGPMLSMTHSDLNVNIGDTVTFTNTSTDQTRQFWVYNMDVNDTSSATEIKRSYPQKGNYVVSLFGMNEFGCWDTINKTVRVGTVGINDPRTEQVVCTIYPNPSSDQLFVDLKDKPDFALIQIIDANGKQVSVEVNEVSTGLYQANTTELSNGLYIIQITYEGHNYNARFLVNR